MVDLKQRILEKLAKRFGIEDWQEFVKGFKTAEYCDSDWSQLTELGVDLALEEVKEEITKTADELRSKAADLNYKTTFTTDNGEELKLDVSTDSRHTMVLSADFFEKRLSFPKPEAEGEKKNG